MRISRLSTFLKWISSDLNWESSLFLKCPDFILLVCYGDLSSSSASSFFSPTQFTNLPKIFPLCGCQLLVTSFHPQFPCQCFNSPSVLVQYFQLRVLFANPSFSTVNSSYRSPKALVLQIFLHLLKLRFSFIVIFWYYN